MALVAGQHHELRVVPEMREGPLELLLVGVAPGAAGFIDDGPLRVGTSMLDVAQRARDARRRGSLARIEAAEEDVGSVRHSTRGRGIVAALTTNVGGPVLGHVALLAAGLVEGVLAGQVPGESGPRKPAT